MNIVDCPNCNIYDPINEESDGVICPHCGSILEEFEVIEEDINN